MSGLSLLAAGEEYLAYNRRRWAGDGWTHDLRRSGAPDGAKFADWQWWPNTLKVGGCGGTAWAAAAAASARWVRRVN